MFSRFLFWSVFFTVAGGLLLNSSPEIPKSFRWFGVLPGDMILTKGDVIIHFPIVSAALLAGLILFVISILAPSR